MGVEGMAMGWREQIRAEVVAAGGATRGLAEGAGIDPANLRKFVATDGEVGLSLDSAERLAGLLGLALVKAGTPYLGTEVADTPPVVVATTEDAPVVPTRGVAARQPTKARPSYEQDLKAKGRAYANLRKQQGYYA
jgi:hypothetical protein